MSIRGTDAILTKNSLGFFDFSLDGEGSIDTEDFFDTFILMAIFCERRANASEVPNSERRRGWIGNESTPGFEIGSKIWLFEQSRVDRDTLNGIGNAADDALQTMVDDEIAISVKSEVVLLNDEVTLVSEIERPNSKVERRYFELWNNTGNS